MKPLELTKAKAVELNEICQFAIEKGILSPFDIHYYQTKNPKCEIHYYRHLIDVAKQYDINKLLEVSGNAINATHNTNEFLKAGGFKRILEIEEREDRIQDFTLRNLRQSIFATKDWWLLFAFTTLLTIIVTIITSSFADKIFQNSSTQKLINSPSPPTNLPAKPDSQKHNYFTDSTIVIDTLLKSN